MSLLNPKQQAKLDDLVEKLSSDKPDDINIGLAKAIQEQINGSVSHFLALGRLRTVEFEEALLDADPRA